MQLNYLFVFSFWFRILNLIEHAMIFANVIFSRTIPGFSNFQNLSWIFPVSRPCSGIYSRFQQFTFFSFLFMSRKMLQFPKRNTTGIISGSGFQNSATLFRIILFSLRKLWFGTFWNNVNLFFFVLISVDFNTL